MTIEEDFKEMVRLAKAMANVVDKDKMIKEFNRYSEIVDRVGVLSHDGTQFCQCGTCTEALEAAFRLYSQLRENHCKHWITQIAAGLQYIGEVEDACRTGIALQEVQGIMGDGNITPERENEISVLGALCIKAGGALYKGMQSLYASEKSPIREDVTKVEAKVYEEYPRWV